MILPLSFCVLAFQSAAADCNLANQVSGFIKRVTIGCEDWQGRSFISEELPGLIESGWTEQSWRRTDWRTDGRTDGRGVKVAFGDEGFSECQIWVFLRSLRQLTSWLHVHFYRPSGPIFKLWKKVFGGNFFKSDLAAIFLLSYKWRASLTTLVQNTSTFSSLRRKPIVDPLFLCDNGLRTLRPPKHRGSISKDLGNPDPTVSCGQEVS